MPVVADVMPESTPVLTAFAFVSWKCVCARPVTRTEASTIALTQNFSVSLERAKKIQVPSGRPIRTPR